MFFMFKLIIIFIIVTALQIDEAYLLNNSTLDDIARSNLSCQIPNNSLYTKYERLNEDITVNRYLKPGEYLPNFGVVRIVCERNYKLMPFKVDQLICLKGLWSPPPSIFCLLACPRLMSTASHNVVCEYKGSILDHCKDPVEGTTANITCNPFYTGNGLNQSSIHSCSEGRWKAPILSQCKPVCGLKRSNGISTIVGGQVTASGDYPWQVGIYDANKNLICGGAIIERNIILSAAHCFTDYNGTVQPVEYYLIAAGKYYSGYDDNRDSMAQFSRVSEIHVPSRYMSQFSSYEFDISVLILKNPFTLSLGVQPVCIELNKEEIRLDRNITGIITGWGFTEKGQEISNVLKELAVPYISFKKCIDEIPTFFLRYLTNDKFCGGYINKTMAVCSGDSGGSLVIYNSANNRYFIKGIISLSPTIEGEQQCDTNQYSLYTSVIFHMKFVKDIINNNRLNEVIESPSDDENKELSGCKIYNGDVNGDILKNNFVSCILPDFPPNGKYFVENLNNTYKPRNYVPEATRLFLICDSAYSYDPPYLNQYLCSGNGIWIPPPANCARVCPTLTSSVSTNIRCEYNGQPLVNCENPVEGTRVLLSCNQFYEDSIIQKNPILECSEGKWNSSIPQCSPICGNPTNPNEEYHSWHVGKRKYESHENILKLLIGNIDCCKLFGSISTCNFNFSAAECFIDYDNNIQPAENFLVAAGKFYREYDDPRDKDAQYSMVLEIHIHEKYKGRIKFNTYNVAILILLNPLLMSTTVQPVCLQLNDKTENIDSRLYNNGLGEVRGWGATREAGRLSVVLKRIEILYIPIFTCISTVPTIFKIYINVDKICGAYTRNASPLCGGDSGGGLVFRSNIGRYYIKGIASDSSSIDRYPCHLGNYTVFTSLFYHQTFLKNTLDNYL